MATPLRVNSLPSLQYGPLIGVVATSSHGICQRGTRPLNTTTPIRILAVLILLHCTTSKLPVSIPDVILYHLHQRPPCLFRGGTEEGQPPKPMLARFFSHPKPLGVPVLRNTALPLATRPTTNTTKPLPAVDVGAPPHHTPVRNFTWEATRGTGTTVHDGSLPQDAEADTRRQKTHRHSHPHMRMISERTDTQGCGAMTRLPRFLPHQ